jgi:hypothetical protein
LASIEGLKWIEKDALCFDKHTLTEYMQLPYGDALEGPRFVMLLDML